MVSPCLKAQYFWASPFHSRNASGSCACRPPCFHPRVPSPCSSLRIQDQLSVFSPRAQSQCVIYPQSLVCGEAGRGVVILCRVQHPEHFCKTLWNTPPALVSSSHHLLFLTSGSALPGPQVFAKVLPST